MLNSSQANYLVPKRHNKGYQFPLTAASGQTVHARRSGILPFNAELLVWQSRPVCAEPPARVTLHQETFVFGRVFFRAILEVGRQGNSHHWQSLRTG